MITSKLKNEMEGKNKLSLQYALVHGSLKRAQGETTHSKAASSTDPQQEAETTDWIDQFCSEGSSKLSHPEQLKLNYYALQENDADTHSQGGPLCDKSYRANTSNWPSFCAPEHQSSSSHNLSALRTTVFSKPKWDWVDDIHTGAQYSRLDKSYTLKQLLSTYEQSNNLRAWCSTPRLLTASDTTSRKWISSVSLKSKLLKLSTTKSEITITGSIGPRPANQHTFYLLRAEPHVSLQTLEVNCCHILIQQFLHLR